MGDINNINPNKEILLQASAMNSAQPAKKETAPEAPQQKVALAPVSEALGKSMVKVDNHDADMQRLLKNPQLAEVSDKMFNAACKAGVAYPEAATFATIDS